MGNDYHRAVKGEGLFLKPAERVTYACAKNLHENLAARKNNPIFAVYPITIWGERQTLRKTPNTSKEDTMEFKLQTLRFNATEKLVAFIDKKIAKLEKHGEVQNVELTLQVVKPETANNKEAKLHVVLPGRSIHTVKVADTFEEAVDLCVDVARRELAENKENHG